MLALEDLGFDLVVGSINPPPNSFRHERFRQLRAEIFYPPPAEVLKEQAVSPDFESKLGDMLRRHQKKYGPSFKAEVRARNAYHFGNLFKKLGVGHVHVHFANRATHTALFMREMGLPFSFTAHAQDFMVDLGSDELLREMSDSAEFVVAVSDYSKKLLQDLCPNSADKIFRVYNGMEPGDFPYLERGSAELSERIKIISVGRLIEFKGFHHLVSSCRILKDRGVEFNCEIIGEGPWRERLEAQIVQEGLENDVLLPGVKTLDEVKKALSAADVFALPCIIDSKGASDILPTVITEAMACRLPVVSTRLVGVPEMVVDGETGILVEPGSPERFADALQEIAADRRRASEMGKNGRSRMEKIFARSVTAPQLANRFEKLLSAQPDAANSSSVRDQVLVLCGNPALSEAGELAAFAAEQGVTVISGAPASDDLNSKIEFFPDASVIEAAWQFAPDNRQKCEHIRAEIGMTAIDGELYYQCARRAVYLLEVFAKRPSLNTLHACRSLDVPVAWIVKRLSPEIRVFCAIESNPALSRSGLAKMLDAFDDVSIGDAKLDAMLEGNGIDHLKLEEPPVHRTVKFGPLKFKLRNNLPELDRAGLVRRYLDVIREKPN